LVEGRRKQYGSGLRSPGVGRLIECDRNSNTHSIKLVFYLHNSMDFDMTLAYLSRLRLARKLVTIGIRTPT
jgi:hypothetical protein